MRVNLSVEEIVIRDGLRSRTEEAVGERRRVLAWALAVVILLVLSLGYATSRRNVAQIAPPATSGPAGDPAAQPAPVLFVHVAGAVAKPGLYRFREGMRVADAVDAAGGPLPKADVDAINLADLLTDRMKIDVPVRGETTSVIAAPSASPGPVDLNTADQVMLETIPGIGPVTATAILQHRMEIGAFDTVEQLLDVTGIGPATLEALRPYVTV